MFTEYEAYETNDHIVVIQGMAEGYHAVGYKKDGSGKIVNGKCLPMTREDLQIAATVRTTGL